MIRSGGVAFHDDLAPLMHPIGEAQPHPENNNEGDVDLIEHSIESNGMYRPVLVQRSTGYILAGNHTWQAVNQKGSEVCPMVFLDVDDTTAYRIMLDDNHIARLALTQPAQTLALLEKIKESEGSVTSSSYRDSDLEVLKQLAEIPLEYDEFAQWPTLSLQVHPRLIKAFRHITRECDNDRDRFEVLLRLAGWDGN